MKLNIILDKDWLEATWEKEIITQVDGEEDRIETTQVWCESYSGHPEHIGMLRVKASEYGTSLDEYENLIAECESKFVYPTDEEIAQENLENKIQEAKNYLSATSWIWEKYSRNVLVLKDLTVEEFNTKYQDIISNQEQCRLDINNLEQELLALKTKGTI